MRGIAKYIFCSSKISVMMRVIFYCNIKNITSFTNMIVSLIYIFFYYYIIYYLYYYWPSTKSLSDLVSVAENLHNIQY